MAEVWAAVIAKNEEENIVDCLDTLRWADEIVVLVDDSTDDSTADLARFFTDHVHLAPFESFPQMRNLALEIARGDWVFFVDADERASEELSKEIRQVVESGGRNGSSGKPAVGLWVPRRNIMFRRWVRYAGWYPDYQLRLLLRGHARYDETRLVHERVITGGPEGHLDSPLIHYNYHTLAQFHVKQNLYSQLDALGMYRNGQRPKLRHYVTCPLREFFRRYVSLRGYKDGPVGLLLAILMAYNSLAVEHRLRLLWRGAGQKPKHS